LIYDYLNHSTFSISESSFGNNPTGLSLSDFPVVKISLELVTSSKHCKASSRTATSSLWTGMFWDGISSIPDETVILLWLGCYCLVCGNTTRRWGWLLHQKGYGITHHLHHHICHGVGPLVDPFRSHVSRSLYKGLPWFLLPDGK